MKLSFSTFGWHDYTWQDFCEVAKDGGFAGIEVHNIHEPKLSEKTSIWRTPRTAR